MNLEKTVDTIIENIYNRDVTPEREQEILTKLFTGSFKSRREYAISLIKTNTDLTYKICHTVLKLINYKKDCYTNKPVSVEKYLEIVDNENKIDDPRIELDGFTDNLSFYVSRFSKGSEYKPEKNKNKITKEEWILIKDVLQKNNIPNYYIKFIDYFIENEKDQDLEEVFRILYPLRKVIYQKGGSINIAGGITVILTLYVVSAVIGLIIFKILKMLILIPFKKNRIEFIKQSCKDLLDPEELQEIVIYGLINGITQIIFSYLDYKIKSYSNRRIYTY